MRVDCHTHINCLQSEAGLAEHLEAAEKVDVCVVLAAPGQDANKDVNKELAGYIAKHKDKIVGFGLVNPINDKVGLKKLSTMKDKSNLRGVVLYCADGGFHPAHSRAMRFYEAAEQAAIPVFFHNAPVEPGGVLDYAQPYLLDEVARRFGSLKMVIGSMGMPFVEQTLCMVQKHKNVYADLTIQPRRVWEVYNIVMTAHEWGVMDKLLFGSGFPFGDAGTCIETLLGFNKLLADTNLPVVPRGQIRNIIERNSLEVLGIKTTPTGD